MPQVLIRTAQEPCVSHQGRRRSFCCIRYVAACIESVGSGTDSDAAHCQAGFLAQKRLARGVQLNQTEAVALIATQLQERIRDGKHSVAELMQHGKTLLGRRHVLPGVSALLHEIQVEGTFPDG